jgi:hypothetical protein
MREAQAKKEKNQSFVFAARCEDETQTDMKPGSSAVCLIVDMMLRIHRSD